MLERLLNVKEVAQLLNVKENTVYDWVCIQFIPYIKLGRLVRFNQSEVLKWLDNRTNNGRTKRIPDIKLTNIRN